MISNPSRDVKHVVVEAPAVAGTTALTSAAVDCQGFETVTFCYHIGTITSGSATSFQLYSESDGNAAGGTAITGALVTIADDGDNKLYMCTVVKPIARYVYAVLTRSTQNAVLDLGWAVLTGPDKSPVTHDATTVGTPVVVASDS